MCRVARGLERAQVQLYRAGSVKEPIDLACLRLRGLRRDISGRSSAGLGYAAQVPAFTPSGLTTLLVGSPKGDLCDPVACAATYDQARGSSSRARPARSTSSLRGDVLLPSRSVGKEGRAVELLARLITRLDGLGPAQRRYCLSPQTERRGVRRSGPPLKVC